MPCGGDSIIESVQLVGLYLWMHDPARRAVTNSGTCDSSRHRVGGAVAYWRNRDTLPLWDNIASTFFTVTDDPDDAVMRVLECYERRCAGMPAAPVKADAQ